MRGDSPQHACVRLTEVQYRVSSIGLPYTTRVLYEFFLLKNHKHEPPIDVWYNLKCAFKMVS